VSLVDAMVLVRLLLFGSLTSTMASTRLRPRIALVPKTGLEIPQYAIRNSRFTAITDCYQSIQK
jgi:hypothetical protein